jgi:hypothetical protein
LCFLSFSIFMGHSFHIPVLGLAFSVDTPIKVAHWGISSVASIVDDILLERLRKYYSQIKELDFVPIPDTSDDFRSKRITAYLNLVLRFVNEKIEDIKKESFEQKGDLVKYFELLPENSSLKKLYHYYLSVSDETQKTVLEAELKSKVIKGAIDVNIMAKVDKNNFNQNREEISSDALEALKGFAESDLESSVVLSAGMNPRLYSYLESFKDFYPDENQSFRKKVILKVSDYRSALIQAKFLAKKGIWISEFRIESGLNCGGHAFATDGFLMGPILEEFKTKRSEMISELFTLYQKALESKEMECTSPPVMRISVQGGIGTAEENQFLLDHYELDATGWGSPFLLVPEATTVDEETLQALVKATQKDFYISGSSPLGVPFNNFRYSSSEKQRLERIAKGRPGSPCIKKYLVSNTEFTAEPLCTASRQYQHLKIKQLQKENLEEKEYQQEYDKITEKVCLCEGLSTPAFLKYDILKPRESKAVAICPGPNTAYFSGIFSLEEMVKHIYGNLNLLAGVERSNVFINELNLYVTYLKKDINNNLKELTEKKVKYFDKFKNQLQNGINYYKELIPNITNQTESYHKKMMAELVQLETQLKEVINISPIQTV